ncbi:LppX_LprAFG lipoprotein [Gordonia shandongensis]|uniref:LppX_LprAFG lipoprotein n=1 Tax=Gordonia shandongensis TaxID=376351 RepID=UPI0003F4C476|nr:LppX_LprAFG lipoprotein [Gordonia shandongensis]
MKRSKRFAALAAALAVAGSVALTGCSDSDADGDAPASSDPGAASTLNAAADATAALTGAHLQITVDGKLQSLNASSVEADVQTKPEIVGEGTATLTMGQKSTKAPFVYVDGRMYADIDDQGYIDYGDGRSIYDVSKVLDDEKGVPAVLRSIDGAAEDGTEAVDGTEATKITGTVAAADLSGLTGLSEKAKGIDEEIPVTVWVAKDGSNHVLRVEAAPAKDASLTVTLSDFDKKVEVSKPKDVKRPSKKPTSTDPSQPTREPAA